MSRTIAATIRRANRLMRQSHPSRSLHKLQKNVTAAMVDAAFAPLTNMAPKPAKRKKARPRERAGKNLGLVITKDHAVHSLKGDAGQQPANRGLTPRIPRQAQYLARTHRCTAGRRTFKLYLPSNQPKRPKGLILMLHGCD